MLVDVVFGQSSHDGGCRKVVAMAGLQRSFWRGSKDGRDGSRGRSSESTRVGGST
jgi:hypothetical protein